MSIWDTLLAWFRSPSCSDTTGPDTCLSDGDGCAINPATGLPMVGGCGGVDVAGNPWGTDLHHDDAWSSPEISGLDDDWSSPSGWDDPFASSWDSGGSSLGDD